ncbi:MAG: ANTAR domain-containing protein [Spirochaetales bacterium]|jgi:AmiR/NasT family two-component response regulator|nr:ANTAR domain-containing protein [Spirochaetales bacterium]
MTTGRKILRSLRNKKVAVVHKMDEDGRTIVLQLQRIGCQVKQLWPSPEQLPKGIDAVFFVVDPETSSYFDWLGEKGELALIAIISYENPTVLEVLSDLKVHSVIVKPVRSLDILARLVTALASFKYEERLVLRIEKLDETLKTRRFVERAMKILAKNNDLPDEEAYALIRAEAMNKQITLFEMANSIINVDRLMNKQ